MNDSFERRRAWQELLGDAPPPWTVRVVKACAIGILALPVCTTLLLVACSALGAKGVLVPVAVAVSVVLWVGMFLCAQVLTTRYPRVPRER